MNDIRKKFRKARVKHGRGTSEYVRIDRIKWRYSITANA